MKTSRGCVTRVRAICKRCSIPPEKVVAPPDTPREIAEKLSAGIRTAFQAPEAAKRLTDLRATAVLNTPAEAARIFKQDSERWGAVIKANNIKGE